MGKKSPGSKEAIRNLHIEVPESFHRRIKMLCAMNGRTLKEYAFRALQEKVSRDSKRSLK